MDSRTGQLYPSVQAAKDAGVPEEFIVEVPEEAEPKKFSTKARAHNRAQNKQARKSRKINRRK